MNQAIYYVSKNKPLSHNKNGSKKEYKDMYVNDFNNRYSYLYPNIPIKNDMLQSKLVYIFHDIKESNIPDVDNLSKPIVDAFSGVIYKDDRQIVQRSASRIGLENLQFITIEFTKMPGAVANDLNEFILNSLAVICQDEKS